MLVFRVLALNTAEDYKFSSVIAADPHAGQVRSVGVTVVPHRLHSRWTDVSLSYACLSRRLID